MLLSERCVLRVSTESVSFCVLDGTILCDLMTSFHANYRRFTLDTTQLLVRISNALGTIRGARVLPAVADQLRASALAGTVHYSNVIEGNQLPFVEAERAARHQLMPDTRAKIELVNYVAALDLIDERLASGSLELTSDFAKELHGTGMKGLGREDDEHFKPHHEGAWRDGIALVVDKITGTIMHEGPPKDAVPGLMDDVFDWHASKQSGDAAEPPYVLAGVLHYWVTEIHPFADGNGRAARLLQTASLMAAGVLPGRMFSFERYYANDRGAYYGALRSVTVHHRNLEMWLAYFLSGLAEEYERVAATVADLASLVASAGDGPLRLTPGQERALAALRIGGKREFARREYQEAAAVGKTAAYEELKELVRHGVLVTKGAGPSTRYAFASKVDPVARRGSGRRPMWTDERVERELRRFLAGRDAWPQRQDFLSADRGDLYSAASRAGGIRRWRRVFGL